MNLLLSRRNCIMIQQGSRIFTFNPNGNNESTRSQGKDFHFFRSGLQFLTIDCQLCTIASRDICHQLRLYALYTCNPPSIYCTNLKKIVSAETKRTLGCSALEPKDRFKREESYATLEARTTQFLHLADTCGVCDLQRNLYVAGFLG